MPGRARNQRKAVGLPTRPDAVGAPALGPLGDAIGFHIRRAQLRIFADFAEACADLDLTPSQFGILSVIGANPGRPQREIADCLGIARPNFVALMDQFEKRGWAERRVSETDRRSYALFLSRKGQEVLDEATSRQRAHEDRVLDALDYAERDELMALLRKL